MRQLTDSEINVGDNLDPLTKHVSAKTIIMGAAATRDWQPLHHDHKWATEQAGTRDIILNAPSQAGWIGRYITDWAGPRARVGKMGFKMKASICPGDELVLRGTVTAKEAGGECGTWVTVSVDLCVGDEVRTSATVKVAVPDSNQANPWRCDPAVWRV